MADLQARFTDVQRLLPHMSRAILALGIVQVFGFFFSGLFVFIVVGSRQGKVKDLKFSRGLPIVRGQWGWEVFGKLKRNGNLLKCSSSCVHQLHRTP